MERFYAIKLGKWVEIRRASTPLRTTTSKFPITAKLKRLYWDEDNIPHSVERKIRKFITIYDHKGGKVIGIVPLRDYHDVMNKLLVESKPQLVPKPKLERLGVKV